MKSKIYKYELKPGTDTHLNLPIGSEVLSVQNQNEKIILYVKFDSEYEEDLRGRHFLAAHTGSELFGVIGKFIGTVMLDGGSYVCHIFDMDNA
jgi:hypothetical protein